MELLGQLILIHVLMWLTEALEVLVQATIVYLDDCDDTEIEISLCYLFCTIGESTDADVSIGSDGRFVLEGHVYGSDAIGYS